MKNISTLLLNPLAIDDPKLINSGMMELSRELSERERERESEGERERICMWCTCTCVFVCAILFHPGCEKNSDQITIIVLCSQ